MAEGSITVIIRKYLQQLRDQGIPVAYGILFGSYAHGQAGQWSDIDLLVVSPYFDVKRQRKDLNILWRTAARVDSRIEPIPVGQRQYILDDSSAILEIARREGEIIPLVD